MASIRNNRNFIIVGRKGTGKSSCCMAIAHSQRQQDYQTTFYNFTEDMNRSELAEAAKTQVMDLRLDPGKITKLYDSIIEFYDFRELWKRKVVFSIAQSLRDQGQNSEFIRFVGSIRLADSSITEGVTKGPSISIPNDNWMADLFKKFGQVKPADSRISLADFNKISLRLLREYHPNVKHFFFFDELNLSYLKSESSEFETLLALVRDTVRAAADLNDFFVVEKLDVHIMCCLRPEVRDEIVKRDNEISKVIESNYASLSWPNTATDDNPLIEMLRRKMGTNFEKTDPQWSDMFPKTVRSPGQSGHVTFNDYFLNLTWYRPRDVVRVLKSYQSTNGIQTQLFSPQADMIRFIRPLHNDGIP